LHFNPLYFLNTHAGIWCRCTVRTGISSETPVNTHTQLSEMYS